MIFSSDSDEHVRYIYEKAKDLQTKHKILAIMLGFVVVEMTQLRGQFNKEAYLKARRASLEIERFLELNYEPFRRNPGIS